MYKVTTLYTYTINKLGDIETLKIEELGIAMFGVCIAIVMISALMPTAITNWMGANTTGWDPATLAIWNIGPLVIVGGIVMAIFLALFARSKGRGSL